MRFRIRNTDADNLLDSRYAYVLNKFYDVEKEGEGEDCEFYIRIDTLNQLLQLYRELKNSNYNCVRGLILHNEEPSNDAVDIGLEIYDNYRE